MNPLLKLIFTIGKYIYWLTIISIVIYFFYLLFDLLGLTIDVYGYYLAWLVAMGLFYLTLPQHNNNSIFS